MSVLFMLIAYMQGFCGEQAVIVDELNVLGISLASWRKRWNFKRVFKLDVMGKQL